MRTTIIKTNSILIKRGLLTLNICFIIFINGLFSLQLFSQQINKPIERSNVAIYNEKLYIRTDRDIYISGEQVWFKVYKVNGLNDVPSDISKVVYLELLDKNNFPVKQLIIKAEGNSASSGFNLPDNISSGNYLIRAYTNWMKNFPVDFFCYKEISVINPFEDLERLNLPSDSLMKKILNSDSKSISAVGSIAEENNKQLKLTLNLSSPDYSLRDKVKIQISAADMAGNQVEADLSVSVTKTSVLKSLRRNVFRLSDGEDKNQNTIILSDTSPVYLPELEGHLISGYLKSRGTGEPMKLTDISLSYVGKTARNQFGKTDENGEFYFLVKESGLNEIVIQPLSYDIAGYYIDLKQPFSSTFNNHKPSQFFFDSSKIQELNNAVISMQINNIYEPFRQKKELKANKNIPDFYGKPENTILMADYIELTSLREVVKEIIPDVYTLKQNGKYDFKLINKFRGQPFENKPLVLVDGVPIYDFEKVLSINSREIERADIINTRYFFSEYVFDGIVSFITKKGNLGAMEFDNSIFRQVYEGCQVRNDFYSPDYGSELLKGTRIPDFRNTLYWEPDLRTGKDGKAATEFYTSDETVEYTIVVEGISGDGKKGSTSSTFSVK